MSLYGVMIWCESTIHRKTLFCWVTYIIITKTITYSVASICVCVGQSLAGIPKLSWWLLLHLSPTVNILCCIYVRFTVLTTCIPRGASYSAHLVLRAQHQRSRQQLHFHSPWHSPLTLHNHRPIQLYPTRIDAYSQRERGLLNVGI